MGVRKINCMLITPPDPLVHTLRTPHSRVGLDVTPNHLRWETNVLITPTDWHRLRIDLVPLANINVSFVYVHLASMD